MKILVVGAGFTGCTLARLMSDRDHNVSIQEKLNHIGGLCYSKKSNNGILYEPCGAHTFHTKDKRAKEFVQRFSKFNTYMHKKGIMINGILRHFPLSIETIKEMPEKDQILKEIEEGLSNQNCDNFETYMISLVGKTLYELYIYNYTKKMWGIEPKELNSDWATNRVEIRESNSELFKDQWQGLPIEGYTNFFENMISNIPIEYDKNMYNISNYDLVLFSGKIDELYQYKFDILPYRSLRFEYKFNEPWENENFGTINLPQHPIYIRKTNFNVLYRQNMSFSCIQYQKSVPAKGSDLPMYPIYTRENLTLFDRYLKEACISDKVIPVGRLGLYKYLDMDKAVSLSMDLVPLIEKWKDAYPDKKYQEIKKILDKY